MYYGRTLSFFGFELSTHSESNDVQSVTVTVTILNKAAIHSALMRKIQHTNGFDQ